MPTFSHGLVVVTALILYSTDGCHLCEHAKEKIFSVIDGGAIALTEVDIATDDALMARYGVSIPVLKNLVTEQECHWPFEAADIQKLIGD